MTPETELVILETASDIVSATLRELAAITRFYGLHLNGLASRYALRHDRESAAMFAGSALVAHEIAERLEDEAFRVLVGEAL